MALELLMLQIPLGFEQVDMTDYDWRDRNLDSLPFWHFCFSQVLPESIELLYQYFSYSVKYREILLEQCSDEPQEYLLEHVKQEAEMWLINAMNEISYHVWGDVWRKDNARLQ